MTGDAPLCTCDTRTVGAAPCPACDPGASFETETEVVTYTPDELRTIIAEVLK